MAVKLKTLHVYFIICIFSSLFFFSVSGDNERAEGEERVSSFSLSKIFRVSGSWWENLRAMVGRGHAYLFPPKVDFSGKDEAVGPGGGATGDKVKEVLVKSLEEGKETVEDSAKAAAEMAGEALQTTKDKVQDSLSGKHTIPDDRAEL